MNFDRELVALYPALRAYAIKLLGKMDGADDLVQETMARAVGHAHQFRPGTNLAAWAMTILHNFFCSEFRKEKRRLKYEVGRGDKAPDVEVDAREQFMRVALRQALEMLDEVPREQQQAIRLIALGYSYEEVAALCDAPVGTVKSRTSRGRAELRDFRPEDF